MGMNELLRVNTIKAIRRNLTAFMVSGRTTRGAGSTQWGNYSSLIASVGHALAHVPQLMHFSASIT